MTDIMEIVEIIEFLYSGSTCTSMGCGPMTGSVIFQGIEM
jgi:hypothetical protein